MDSEAHKWDEVPLELADEAQKPLSRQELKEKLYALVERPLNNAMTVFVNRYSPQMRGYSEFADGKGIFGRNEQEWAHYSDEHREAYELWGHARYRAGKLGEIFNNIADPEIPLEEALGELNMHVAGLYQITAMLDPEKDAKLIAELDTAADHLKEALSAERVTQR